MANNWVHKEDALGETPLVRAMRCGERTLTEFMLGQDGDEELNTPPENAAAALQSAAYWGSAQAVHALLENGVDATDRDQWGETPLHKAVRNGHRETVETLLEHGAQVNVPDVRGLTPLHWAALAGEADVAEMLLEQGADSRAAAPLLGDLSPCSIARLMQYDEVAEVLEAHNLTAV